MEEAMERGCGLSPERRPERRGDGVGSEEGTAGACSWRIEEKRVIGGDRRSVLLEETAGACYWRRQQERVIGG
jgi:hypothetical protein